MFGGQFFHWAIFPLGNRWVTLPVGKVSEVLVGKSLNNESLYKS